MAVEVQPVLNLNLTNPWESISETVSSGAFVYFVAKEPEIGHLDLWRTDGTTAGTIRLTELGVGDGRKHELTNFNGTLYFRGFDEAHGVELWKSDGSVTGTRLIKDMAPGPASTYLRDFVPHKSFLFFTANGQFARSNGTTSATVIIADLVTGQDRVENLSTVGDSLFFTARNPAGDSDLFRSNGSRAGTKRVADIPAGVFRDLTAVGDQLFFFRGGGELWKTGGALPASSLVGDVGNGTELTNVNGIIFFAVAGEIWKSDGTTAGTEFVKQVGDDVVNLFGHQGALFFAGGSIFADGMELWKSDGSESGTTMVKNIAPFFNEGYGDSSDPSGFTSLDGRLYFLANPTPRSGYQREIWRTDGTEAGTLAIEGGFNKDLVSHNGELFFARAFPESFVHFSLARRDNVQPISVGISRTGNGNGDASPSAVVGLGDYIYFSATDGISGRELWRFNTVTSVANLVKDIVPGERGAGINVITSFRNEVYFSVVIGRSDYQLWKTDGTEAGTQFLTSVQTLSQRKSFVPVGNTMYFAGYRSTDGWELWKTDGTTEGTIQVKDIYPGRTYEYGTGYYPNSANPSSLVNLNGKLFFYANNGTDGGGLWTSDGTTSGTVMFADLNQDPYSYEAVGSYPSGMKNLNGVMYFFASNQSGRGVWKSDGSVVGTARIKGLEDGLGIGPSLQFVRIGKELLFVGSDSTDGIELWKTDGSKAGTTLVRDIRAGGLDSEIRNLTAGIGKIYFTADDGVHGRELWESDGTPSGTKLVRDIRSGLDLATGKPWSSEPEELTHINGVLYFTADNGVRGREVWRTNGNAAGATLMRDVLVGPGSSEPENLRAFNSSLYFSAKWPIGRELWSVRVDPILLSVSPSSVHFVEGGDPVSLALEAVLSDTNAAVLVGGTLTVSFLSPVQSSDHLTIQRRLGISLVGSLVQYNNIVIGRFSGGGNGGRLIVTLNSNAALPAVQALIRAIAFRSSSQAPDMTPRVVRFAFTDGQGAMIEVQKTVEVVPMNDAPDLSGISPTQKYQLNAAAIRIAALAIVRDVDSLNFDGGFLRINAMGDPSRNRLELANPAFTIGPNRELRYRGLLIGSVNASGGFGAMPLRFDFNAAVTATIVRALLRSITFRTEGSTVVADRMINFTINDGDGGERIASKFIEIN